MTSETIEKNLYIRKYGGFRLLTQNVLLKVSGEDAAKYLNTQTSNEVISLNDSEGQANALLDRKAHLMATFTIHKKGDVLWIITEKKQAETIQEHLEKFHFTEDFEMEDLTTSFSFILVQGSISKKVIEGVLSVDLSQSKEYSIFTTKFQNKTSLIIEKSETGERGFLIITEKEISEILKEKLLAKNLIEINDDAMESLRIEAGIPLYNIDMSQENLLPETGLEKIAVSYTKGCYLGQEVVARIKTYGTVPKAIIGLEFSDNDLPAFDSEIIINNKKVGIIKSGTFSPNLQKFIALAYLTKEYRKPGEVIEFAIEEKHYKAIVKLLPFYHPPTPQEIAKKLYDKALEVFAENKEEDAVNLLQQAITEKPDFTDAYESLGVILSRLEKYHQAIEVMTKLAEIAPEEPMARTNLSVFYMKIGNKEEAEAQMAKANALRFTQSMKEGQAKKALEAKKQEELAAIKERLEMFKEVLETEDPDDLIANYGLGKSYFDLQLYHESIPFFQKAIEIKKDYSMAYLFLGKSLEFINEKDKAKDVFKNGIIVASQKGDLMPLKEMERRKLELEKK